MDLKVAGSERIWNQKQDEKSALPIKIRRKKRGKIFRGILEKKMRPKS